MRASLTLILLSVLFFSSGCINDEKSKGDTSSLDITLESTNIDKSTDLIQESKVDVITGDNEHVKNVLITADALNVRKTNSINSDIIAQVYESNIYRIIESEIDTESKIWYKIDVGNGNIGWIASWFCKEFDLSDYAGTYKYTYEYNTEDLIEDHYIVLELENGMLTGRYYGTSDVFESDREGYYPGFFVLDLEELKIDTGYISFSLVLKENEMFSKPIDLIYESYKDVSLENNTLWIQTHLSEGYINYSGTINNDKIIIDTENGLREFLREEGR